jgi:hypothetical protein
LAEDFGGTQIPARGHVALARELHDRVARGVFLHHHHIVLGFSEGRPAVAMIMSLLTMPVFRWRA